MLICPKGVLWFNCVLRGKFHLLLLNREGLLIKWKSPLLIIVLYNHKVVKLYIIVNIKSNISNINVIFNTLTSEE